MAFEGGDGTGGGQGDGGQGGGATGGAADLLGGGAQGGGQGGGDGQGGAGDGAQGSGQGNGDGGGFAFLDKLSAEAGEGETSSNRDWVTAKGFKDLDGLVRSARHAEKAIHDKGMIAVPKDGAKPEEVAAFRAAIGVPDKPDGYEIKGPEGVKLNDGLIGALRESAVKHGAPKGAFEGLVQDFIQLQMDEAAAEAQKQDGLALEWVKAQGGNKDAQLAHVDTAARALGLSKQDMMGLRQGLGADRALGLLAKLGAGMAEDTLITGGKGRFGVTGAEAQNELNRLKNDPEFQKKVLVPGSPERQRWDRLNQAAAEAKTAAEAA
jgi:hypothetical protein